MIVQGGEQGIVGLGFETSHEVHVVTAAAMFARSRLFINDGIVSNLAPGRLANFVEWVSDRLPSGRRLTELQTLGQQAILNAELGDGPGQEAHLVITWAPVLTGTAVTALRRYLPWVEQHAVTTGPEEQFFVPTARAMVAEINRFDPSYSAYAYDF